MATDPSLLLQRESKKHDSLRHSDDARACLSLSCALHLACVRGPDIGTVLPAFNGMVLGRGGTIPLEAPSLSREHVRVVSMETDPRGRPTLVIEELHSRNGTRVFSSSCRLFPRTWKTLTPGRTRALHTKDRLLTGEDEFVIRARPLNLTWPDPPAGSSHPSRRWLSPHLLWGLVPFFLFGLLRLWGQNTWSTPVWPLLVMGCVLVLVFTVVFLRALRKRRSWKDLDAAALALVLATQSARDSFSSPPPTLNKPLCGWVGPTGQRKPFLSVPTQADNKNTPLSRNALSGRCPGFAGPHALATARWWVAQVAASCGGVRLVEVGGLLRQHPSRSSPVVFSSSQESSTRDSPKRTLVLGQGGLRVLMAHDSDASTDTKSDLCIGVAEDPCALPAWCDVIVTSASAPVGQTWWWQCVRDEDTSGRLPVRLDAEELWNSSPDSSFEDGLPALIGVNSRGPVSVNLVTDGPHALVAGTTGSGKSVALTTWLLGMCRIHSPRDLRLVLIDYKGGAAFGPLVNLPHVEAVLTDLDENASERALLGLEAHLKWRESLLRSEGVGDLHAYRTLPPHPSRPCLPRIVLVVDEFHVVTRTHPNTLDALTRLTTQGRSLGMHLIAATQRPAGAVSAHMKANMELRVALRCLDASESLDVLGDTRAAELDKTPGRAILPEHGQVQLAHVCDPDAFVARLAQQWGKREEHTPLWIPPLNPELTWEDLDALANGELHEEPSLCLALAEDLASGTHLPIRWSGSHIRIEGPRSRAQSLSDTALALTARIHSSSFLPVHAVLTHCPADSPALSRLRPSTLIDTRVPGAAGDIACLLEEVCDHGPSLVLIDDLPACLGLLESCLGVLARDLFQSFLVPAHGRGVHLLAASPGALASEITSAIPQRFLTASTPEEILRLGGGVAGARAHTPADLPGRFLTPVPDKNFLECQIPLSPQIEGVPRGTEAKAGTGERGWHVGSHTAAHDCPILIGAECRPLRPEDLVDSSRPHVIHIVSDETFALSELLAAWAAPHGITVEIGEREDALSLPALPHPDRPRSLTNNRVHCPLDKEESQNPTIILIPCPSSQWARLRVDSRSTILAQDPSAEAVRHLISACSTPTRALRAQPRGRRNGILLHKGAAQRLRWDLPSFSS